MRIISLGLGVQSTALYYMSSLGELPRCDYAIFADPGKEKKKTYEYLEFLQDWAKKNNGIPIIIINEKNLFEDLLNCINSRNERFSSIPAFTKNEDGTAGMIRRQCTGEYKIEQVDKAIRKLLNTKTVKEPVEVWKGITTDEWDRMSNPVRNWKTHVYPFTGYKLKSKARVQKISEFKKEYSRANLINWYLLNFLPIPPKSSCIFCPFQSDLAWKELESEDMKSAILIDNAIRNSTKKGLKNPIFLHRSLVPLREIDFSENQLDLWNGNCSDECHI